jgi:hypothetical protein
VVDETVTLQARSLGNRRWLILTGIGLVVAVVAVWFQPQKLFIDKEVNEALPGRENTVSENASEEAGAGSSKNDSQQSATETLGAGSFRALAHDVSGEAKLLQLANGERYLRFENFMVENGPDLRVYVASANARSEASAFGTDFIDLGALKGNVGDQNYKIPVDAARGSLNSAVIWCRRFSVGFAVAPVDG